MMIWAPTSFSAKCKPDILYSEAFVNIFLKIHLAVYDLFAASLHKYASGGNRSSGVWHSEYSEYLR